MNGNLPHDSNGGIAETLKLSEEPSSSVTAGMKSYMRNLFKSIRTNFSKKCEKSLLSNLIEDIYIKSLSSRTKKASVFLLSFGIVSLILNYFLCSSIGNFISDANTFSCVVVIVVGLLLFTYNKTFHNLIGTSKLLGPLSIVYSEQSITFTKKARFDRDYVYSTPFFLGVIFGIFSGIYPVSVICTFIVSIFCIIFIFNRPECGMLFVIAMLPFLSPLMLLVFSCITFLSLLYRYLRGKRHIDFGVTSLLILICAVYVVVRSAVSGENSFSGRIYIYVAFFIFTFMATNLIRSTAMFRRTVQVTIRMTRMFAVILVAYYLSNMFFGTRTISHFVSLMNTDSLIHSLKSSAFVAPFLAMAVPMNFSYLVGSNKKSEIIKNIIYLMLLLSCLLYVSSYALILICILSCVAVLIFFNKKNAFLIIPAPFLAYGLFKLFNAVPSEYRMSASSDTTFGIKTALDIIKSNPFFGSGPNVTDYSGNMVLNVVVTFGIIGLVLLACVIAAMTVKTAKYVSADVMKSDKARFLSIGLLCAQLSLMAVCVFTDIYCGFSIIFLFSAIMSASVTSGKCYEADYIDETIVREYHSK